MPRRAVFIALVFAALGASSAAGADEDMPFPAGLPNPEGEDLVGAIAPEWRGLEWLQGWPVSLADLKGKAVLIRFWTSDCTYCAPAADTLNTLVARYHDKGLEVIGIHSPSSREARDPEVAKRAMLEEGFAFPVATDDAWATLRDYSLDSRFRRYHSVSVLVDPTGIIRWVHLGGDYHRGGGSAHRECKEAYDRLYSVLRRTLPSSNPRSLAPGGRDVLPAVSGAK